MSNHIHVATSSICKKGEGKRTEREPSLRVASLNVGILIDKLLEVIDILKRRWVDIACLQETRWTGHEGEEHNAYKLLYSESDGAKNGVGFLVDVELHKKVIQVIRHNDRIMVLRLVLGEGVVTMVSVYAPQAGLGDQEKKEFWDFLDATVRAVPKEERIFIGGNFNGSIGIESDGYHLVHGGFGFGDRDDSGRQLLDFAVAHDLCILNSFFKKRDSHLITFSCGGVSTQIDYMLMRRGDKQRWKDCKVIPSDTILAQHRLLVADIAMRQKSMGRKRFRKVKPMISSVDKLTI